MHDATRFLLRHYQTLAVWPLQIYSSAIIFSPQSSVVRRGNLDKIPIWFKNIPQMEDTWTSIIQTLAGHSGSVMAVAFSPDGKRIASGSDDGTIKLWDAATGEPQKTLAGHSAWVTAVAFSPDGKRIASGSNDGTIKLWDVAKSLKASRLLGSTFGRHIKFRAWQGIETSETVHTLKFSADGRYLATNLGHIKLKRIMANEESADVESFEHLRISEQWIYYGAAPMLRLPADFEVTCHDVRGNQLTIGFANGRVLSINIDCRRLHSELEAGFRQSRTSLSNEL
jgi:WD40 repeat protein